MTPSDTSGLYGGRGQYGDSDEEQPRVVIRDKRRIDPETGAVREPASAPPADPADPADSAAGFPGAGGARASQTTDAGPEASPTDAVAKELAERTEDLLRVSAEYANYRRRVDRDRVLIGEMAQERLVLDLLPVMDDIDRAREHGDLTGPLKSTADQLTAVLDRAGVQVFGEIGDPFDPGLHEAVLHEERPDVAVPTCTYVMRRGYRRGDRVLRAAMVGVADPAQPSVPVTADPTDDPSPPDESTSTSAKENWASPEESTVDVERTD